MLKKYTRTARKRNIHVKCFRDILVELRGNSYKVLVYICPSEFRVHRTHERGNILKVSSANRGKILKFDPIRRVKLSISFVKKTMLRILKTLV